MKKIEILTKDINGDIRELRTDDQGRLIQGYCMRDCITTASATLTRAQETTVLAGVSGKYMDLIMVSIANSSTSAIKVDLRSSTGGGVEEQIVVGANNDASRQFTVPHPASEKGTTWTAQINSSGEVSDSPITVDMHGIKNNI